MLGLAVLGAVAMAMVEHALWKRWKARRYWATLSRLHAQKERERT
jgi:hypothetical protein